MKLYPLPGGTWVGTEADWKKACKAAGVDHKTLTGAREVPTGKADLMEFLNFFTVDVYRTGAARPTTVAANTVDVEALREQHNPDPAAAPRADYGLPGVLAAEFDAAPLDHRLVLAMSAIDAAREKLAS